MLHTGLPDALKGGACVKSDNDRRGGEHDRSGNRRQCISAIVMHSGYPSFLRLATGWTRRRGKG